MVLFYGKSMIRWAALGSLRIEIFVREVNELARQPLSEDISPHPVSANQKQRGTTTYSHHSSAHLSIQISNGNQRIVEMKEHERLSDSEEFVEDQRYTRHAI